MLESLSRVLVLGVLFVISLIVLIVMLGGARGGGDDPVQPSAAKAQDAKRGLTQDTAKDVREILEVLERDVVDKLREVERRSRDHVSLRAKMGAAMARGRFDLGFRDGTRFVFHYVPPGTFRMGRTEEESRLADVKAGAFQHESSSPQVKTRLARGFFMTRTEITRGQFDLFRRSLKGSGKTVSKLAEGEELYPQVDVSWDEAMAFCVWLSEKTGMTMRLPTEIEWEFAARGRGGFRFATADGADYVPPESVKAPRPVESDIRDESWCGIRDLCGNVSEWTQDVYNAESYQKWITSHPEGRVYVPVLFPESARSNRTVVERVHRGGSFRDLEVNCEAATRRRKIQDDRKGYLGFRVVMILPQDLFEDSSSSSGSQDLSTDVDRDEADGVPEEDGSASRIGPGAADSDSKQ